MQKLDADDPRPQYQQVAAAIRKDVESGRLAPGERLPSHADIAGGYGVSIGTVKRAFGVLQDAGLIVSRQGQPAHVRTRPGEPADGGGVDDADDIRAALAALDRRLAAVERQLSQGPR